MSLGHAAPAAMGGARRPLCSRAAAVGQARASGSAQASELLWKGGMLVTETTAPRAAICLDGDVEMAFGGSPAGRFRMGSRGYRASEEPVHLVEIPEPFWLGETPVTRAVRCGDTRPGHGPEPH